MPKIRRDLSGRHKSDPVVIYAMGLFETSVAEFGRELRALVASGELSSDEARASIEVHVELADAFGTLSMKRWEYLVSIGCNAAGLSSTASVRA